MARDSDLVHRMYGERPPERPRGAVGALPALWILGLVAGGAVACAVSIGVVVMYVFAPGPPLHQWGVVEPEEWVLALHDHSATHDGTAGCALTGQRLVRYDARAPTASVDLRGAVVDVSDAGVEVHDARGATVDCPFAAAEDPHPFADQVRSAIRPASPPAPPLPDGAVPQGR